MTSPGGNDADPSMSGPQRTSTSAPSSGASGRCSSISERRRSPHCRYVRRSLTSANRRWPNGTRPCRPRPPTAGRRSPATRGRRCRRRHDAHRAAPPDRAGAAGGRRRASDAGTVPCSAATGRRRVAVARSSRRSRLEIASAGNRATSAGGGVRSTRTPEQPAEPLERDPPDERLDGHEHAERVECREQLAGRQAQHVWRTPDVLACPGGMRR